MDTPQIGDIWEYSYPRYGTATLLVLEHIDDLDYYVCLKLENGEIGDWCMDLEYESEAVKWRKLA